MLQVVCKTNSHATLSPQLEPIVQPEQCAAVISMTLDKFFKKFNFIFADSFEAKQISFYKFRQPACLRR